MSRNDWFRCTEWSEAVRSEFNARLRRVRSDEGKSQYLRIQALELQQTQKPHLATSALELLERLVVEYPSRIQLAQAHLQRAHCFLALDRSDDAARAFRAALDAERAVPNVRTNAWLDFGWYVVEHARRELFDEALAVLDEFGRDQAGLLFPVQRYKLHGARALLVAERGERARARSEAEAALDAAGRTHSGLLSHATLGLVDRREESKMRQRIVALAQGR